MLSSCASRIHFRAARFVKQFACHSLQIWEISFASVVAIVLVVVVSRGYVTIIFCIALARFQIIFGNYISLSPLSTSSSYVSSNPAAAETRCHIKCTVCSFWSKSLVLSKDCFIILILENSLMKRCWTSNIAGHYGPSVTASIK